MAKSLEQLKEQIRKQEEKRKKMLEKLKAAEAAEEQKKVAIYAKIGAALLENPDYLTEAGRDAVRAIPGAEAILPA